jgi:hypothetical protein
LIAGSIVQLPRLDIRYRLLADGGVSALGEEVAVEQMCRSMKFS